MQAPAQRRRPLPLLHPPTDCLLQAALDDVVSSVRGALAASHDLALQVGRGGRVAAACRQPYADVAVTPPGAVPALSTHRHSNLPWRPALRKHLLLCVRAGPELPERLPPVLQDAATRGRGERQTRQGPAAGARRWFLLGVATTCCWAGSSRSSAGLLRSPTCCPSLRLCFPLPQEGIHPLLAAALPSDALGGLEAQTSLAEIAAKLKSYRPSQTVFEAEVASARKGQGAGGWAPCAHAAGCLLLAMRARRQPSSPRSHRCACPPYPAPQASWRCPACWRRRPMNARWR